MTQDLSSIAAHVSERMGLHFQKNRWPDLARGLEKAAVDLGFPDAPAFTAHLLADEFSPRDVQALASHLSNGETHFFRSPETYAMLQSWLLPELIAAHQDTSRRLRIWSAGCASGQEPFSLAILVSRLIPKLAGWDVTILATDINPGAFAAARVAEYTQWSFRGTPAWVVNGYFTRTHDGRYNLDPVIRDMVTFRYLNLADDVYPSPAVGMHDFDLILCRNVMMYFSADMAVRVGDRLRRCLREGGYLLVTPSEASRDLQNSLTRLVSGGEILYKKTPLAEQVAPADPRAAAVSTATDRTHGARQAAAHALKKRILAEQAAGHRPFRVTHRNKDAQDSALASRPKRVLRDDPTVAPNQTPPAPNEPREAAREARLLADRGEVEQALTCCEAALKRDKFNPALHYLKASILQELGQPDEAERALHSTLFLDGNYALARVMLGAIARGQARSTDAAKHFRAALSLLAQMPADSVLPETDGLTAGEMAETVASLMESECVL